MGIILFLFGAAKSTVLVSAQSSNSRNQNTTYIRYK